MNTTSITPSHSISRTAAVGAARPARRKGLRTAAGILVAATLGSLAVATPAQAASYYQASTTVSGSTVDFKAAIRASPAITVSRLGICVRDSAGKNLDRPSVAGGGAVALRSWWYSLNTTATFSPGTYTYGICYVQSGKWTGEGVTAHTFTVSGAATDPKPVDSVPVVTKPADPIPVVTKPADPVPVASSTMPTGPVSSSGSTWTPVYSEDFTKDASLGQIQNVYGGGMRGYDGFNDTSGKGTYAPDKVLTVKNGALDYHLHTENGKPLVATPIANNWEGQTYGRYSVRFRSDNMPGYKIAFLLWPSSNDWNEGEIDWPEGGLRTGEKMSPASAVKGTYSNGMMKFDPPTRVYANSDSSDWHVATTEWAPGVVRWFWDGQLVGSTTIPSGVPNTDMRWTLQAETDLSGPAPDPSVQGHLQVDWMVQYKLG